MVENGVAILSDLDGTLIDSRASLVRAFAWWTAARGLPPAGDRLPFGLTSADCVRILAPHLDADAEGEALDRRQAEDTERVVAPPGARELLESHRPLAIVTSCTRPPRSLVWPPRACPSRRCSRPPSAGRGASRTPSPTSSPPGS